MLLNSATTYYYLPSGVMLVKVSVTPPGHTTSPVFLEIPKKLLDTIDKDLNRYKEALYLKLKSRDQDQYVLIERKPGMGFERIVPVNPTYDHEALCQWRNWTLESIENIKCQVLVFAHAEIASGKVKITIQWPTHTGYESHQLKPYKLQGAKVDVSQALTNLGFFIPKIKE